MKLYALIPIAAAAALSLAPAMAQQTLQEYLDAPPVADEEADLVRPQSPQAPALFGAETEGYAAEEFYWMNPEADRWPDDLDPRDHQYMPSPEPNVTFELDLGF